MKISNEESQWSSLTAHTATSLTRAPMAVHLAVAALLGDDEIKGSWAIYKPAEPEKHTTWAVFVATPGRLLYTELQFSRESYTVHDDDQDSDNGVTTTVVASWARRLHDIARIDIGACQTRLPRHGPYDWIGVGGVSLTFVDGDRISLPFDQRPMDREEVRQRSDAFLEAIRLGAKI
jgi:hypothetical protein